MKLSLVEIAVTVLAGCSTAVLGQLSASQIISNIQLLTSKSQALQVPAQSISILNGPLVVIGQGPIPQIISGFTDHITTTTTAISQMEGTQPITTTTDADAILNAFLEFVSVHQVLLNILIGKAGLFNTVPFIGQPIAAVLRQDESVVDAFTLAIIDIVQVHAAEIQSQDVSLESSFGTAITSYEGLTAYKRGALDNRSASYRALRV